MVAPLVPQVAYDEITRRHLLQGRRVPSATQVLKACGYGEKGEEFFTDTSRLRGQAVHEGIRLVDVVAPNATSIEEVKESLTLGPKVAPYIAGYLDFKRDYHYVPQLHEETVWSLCWNVIGRMDGHGLSRAPGLYEEPTLIDLKTWVANPPRPSRKAQLQTAIYKILASESLHLRTGRRIIVNLPGDGKYRAHICDGRSDEGIALGLMQQWWDRFNHGLLSFEQAEAE